MTADYQLAIEQHRIDLLLVDDEAAALIEMIAEAACLLIESIAVEPRHQGKGYGRFLLSHAEDVAAAAGFSRIRLYTNRMMSANVDWYARCGYTLDCEEVVALGTIVHMSKAIVPQNGAFG